MLAAAEEAALDAGVALSEQPHRDGVYVNQSAAFSDFHATGANPAANAALTDAAYVAEPVPHRAVTPAPAARGLTAADRCWSLIAGDRR